MKKIFLLALVCFALFGHDMYLKMDTFFLQPNQQAVLDLYNGTFEKSENVIDRDRMLDASFFGNGQRMAIKNDQWTEIDSMTRLTFTTGTAGTWVAGVSTKARTIELDADAFNSYLEHDGALDMLNERKTNNLLEEDAIEKYSKHVKAIFQVGDTKTDDYKTVLGYPIEFVPQSNPYEANTGDTLKFQLLRNGSPLANQLVYADFVSAKGSHSHNNTTHSHDGEGEHSHGNDDKVHSHGNDGEHTHGDKKEVHSHGNDGEHTHDDKKEVHSHGNEGEYTHGKDKEVHSHDNNSSTEETNHTHTTGQQLRTDANGMINVELTADGIWYLRTIHLVTTQETGLTHESNWATLTFEVSHAHDETTHTHEHEHEDGIPSYVYWIASLVIIGGLFFFFYRKK